MSPFKRPRLQAPVAGDLDPAQQIRIVVPAALGIILGASTFLASFLLVIQSEGQSVIAGDPFRTVFADGSA